MKRIYDIETIYLQDWKDEDGKDKPIRIFPLVIKKFRGLAEILEKQGKELEEGEEPASFIDVILEAVAYAMQTYEPALSDVDKLADHVDMPTMEHILEIAGGVKLNDPNLQAAMMAGMS